MEFDVSLIPDDVKDGAHSVCILIDVLRASSTMTTLMNKGCREILLTDNIEAALQTEEIKAADDLLSCAEGIEGNCRAGADFSPSLIGIEQMASLDKKRVLMQTTNGTTAIHKLYQKGGEQILIGCMRNARAVMEKAVLLAAEWSFNLNLVCAGRAASTIYTIDDLYCAARLTEYGQMAARQQGIKWKLNDSAKIALHALTAYDSAAQAFAASASGRVMRQINCHEDISLCAQDSIMQTVPYINREASLNNHADYIVVRPWEGSANR